MTEPSATDSYPSLVVVLPLAREQLAAQFKTQEALTTRATQLLAVAGVVLGLVANSAYLQHRWHALSTAGVVLVVLAAVFSLVGLFVQTYERAGDAARMETTLLHRPASYSQRVVLRATARAVARNQRPLARLTWCIKLGSLALTAGVVLIAIGR